MYILPKLFSEKVRRYTENNLNAWQLVTVGIKNTIFFIFHIFYNHCAED
jgi:hypothetical protein